MALAAVAAFFACARSAYSGVNAASLFPGSAALLRRNLFRSGVFGLAVWGPLALGPFEALAKDQALTASLSGSSAIGKDLKMTRTASGLQYADVREGSGEFPRPGTKVTLDYVMMTTGARFGNKIDSTKDRDEPFSFTLGDKNVIAGLQEGVSSMRAGGVRRLIIPASLGYVTQEMGPVPPGAMEFQRFKNVYFNENRVYQPDLVLDIKLFTFDGR